MASTAEETGRCQPPPSSEQGRRNQNPKRPARARRDRLARWRGHLEPRDRFPPPGASRHMRVRQADADAASCSGAPPQVPHRAALLVQLNIRPIQGRKCSPARIASATGPLLRHTVGTRVGKGRKAGQRNGTSAEKKKRRAQAMSYEKKKAFAKTNNYSMPLTLVAGKTGQINKGRRAGTFLAHARAGQCCCRKEQLILQVEIASGIFSQT